MKLSTKNLSFCIDDNCENAYFSTPAGKTENTDFFRLILDDGFRTEIPVFSGNQTGKAVYEGDRITLTYNSLISDYGDEYDIKFTVEITKKGQLLSFVPTIENFSEVRVNECFCPVCFFEKINGDKKNDVLYMPFGLGSRTVNPYAYLESLAGNYYSHNEEESFVHLHYPEASMCWFGVESDGKFLYMSRKDEKIRACFISVRHTIRSENLALCVDHLPMLKKGEKITFAPTDVGILDGDFREGAKDYRAWAEKAFFKPVEKTEWVKNMTGFQRVIMRSQYGEDYFRPEDLPALYLAGKKYGMDTIFLFSWWKDGLDRNYPYYDEPAEGEFKKLKEKVREVRDMGGRVILEMNCHFIDQQTDFYKKYGRDLAVIDKNGNELEERFIYPGFGEFNASYGARTFTVACNCTKRWRDHLFEVLKLMNSFEPDCLFADCYGAYPKDPCFNPAHEHGNRADEVWAGKRKFFEKAEQYCEEQNKVLATEVVTDIAASYNQFVHGLINADLTPESRQFPAMFRYTFPEVITTTRGILGSENNGVKKIKSALCYGLRIDAQLHASRATVDKDPAYAEAIAFCAQKMKEYSKFYFDGKFTVIDRSELPHCVKRGEFISGDGAEILKVLYNTSDNTVEAAGRTFAPDEMIFEVRKA